MSEPDTQVISLYIQIGEDLGETGLQTPIWKPRDLFWIQCHPFSESFSSQNNSHLDEWVLLEGSNDALKPFAKLTPLGH